MHLNCYSNESYMSGEQMDYLIRAYANNINKIKTDATQIAPMRQAVLSSCPRPIRQQQKRSRTRGFDLVWIDGYGLVRFG